MEPEIQNAQFAEEESQLLEPPKDQDSWKSRVLKGLFVFGLGLVTFLLGVYWFLPLNNIFQVVLQSAASSGVPLEVGEFDISRSGSFNFSRSRYELEGADPEKNDIVGVIYLEGKISPWEFFANDRFELNGMMTGVQVLIDPVVISGGAWNFTVELDDFCDGMVFAAGGDQLCDVMKWTGDVKITATDVMVKYQEISTKVSTLEIKGKVKNGALNLDVSTINSSLANVILQGSMIFTGNGNLNIGVIAIPQEEAYNHDQLGLLLQAAKGQGIIQNDGKIEVRVSGPFKKLNYRFSR